VDREQVIDVLKAAFVHGRLTKDEFDARVGQAFASRTYAELAAVTADIPAGPSATQPPKPGQAQAQPRVNIPVIIAATVVTAGLWAALLFANVDNEAVNTLIAAFAVACLGTLILAGAVLLESRRQKRASGQLPPRPTPGILQR
jgi:hypothetical protein